MTQQKSAYRFSSLAQLAILILVALSPVAAQNIEFTPYVGFQLNGGMDLSSVLYHRIEVQNGVNYGLSLGYLLGDHAGIEFLWNHNQAGTLAQPNFGGTSVKIFNLKTNQYMGDFLFHFSNRETPTRPFVMFGLGATSLSPDTNVSGATKFAFAFGGGIKHNFTPRFGARLQAKWSPTYVTTTNAGIWCDPLFGCWHLGNDHYLNEFDITAGLTVRF